MKVIYCQICMDIQRLIHTEWRTCYCGAAGGQYNKDMNTATIGGTFTRVFGIANPFFNDLWPLLTEDAKSKYRSGNKYGPGDCWWGGFVGDNQLFRIDDPAGPRLKIRVKSIDQATNKITIMDKRPFSIDGRYQKEVLVPSNNAASFKGKKK